MFCGRFIICLAPVVLCCSLLVAALLDGKQHQGDPHRDVGDGQESRSAAFNKLSNGSCDIDVWKEVGLDQCQFKHLFKSDRDGQDQEGCEKKKEWKENFCKKCERLDNGNKPDDEPTAFSKILNGSCNIHDWKMAVIQQCAEKMWHHKQNSSDWGKFNHNGWGKCNQSGWGNFNHTSGGKFNHSDWGQFNNSGWGSNKHAGWGHLNFTEMKADWFKNSCEMFCKLKNQSTGDHNMEKRDATEASYKVLVNPEVNKTEELSAYSLVLDGSCSLRDWQQATIERCGDKLSNLSSGKKRNYTEEETAEWKKNFCPKYCQPGGGNFTEHSAFEKIRNGSCCFQDWTKAAHERCGDKLKSLLNHTDWEKGNHTEESKAKWIKDNCQKYCSNSTEKQRVEKRSKVDPTSKQDVSSYNAVKA